MTLGEIMAHFLITSLEPPVIKAARELLDTFWSVGL
jgi:hypothetical protein